MEIFETVKSEAQKPYETQARTDLEPQRGLMFGERDKMPLVKIVGETLRLASYWLQFHNLISTSYSHLNQRGGWLKPSLNLYIGGTELHEISRNPIVSDYRCRSSYITPQMVFPRNKWQIITYVYRFIHTYGLNRFFHPNVIKCCLAI